MLSDERKSALFARLAEVTAERNRHREDMHLLDEEQDAIAREYILNHTLHSTSWKVADGNKLVATEPIGRELIKLFAYSYAHSHDSISFDLTGTPAPKSEDVALDVLRWLQGEKLLRGEDPDVEALHRAYQENLETLECRFVSPYLDEGYTVHAHVYERTLTLSCDDTDTLIAFVEEHKLDVRWDDAEKAILEAEAAAERARQHAESVRFRLSRFLAKR